MKIHFTIPIIPKSQMRDRIGSFGGHGRSYKDKTQKAYESKLNVLIDQYKPLAPSEGALEMSIKTYLPIPVSKPKKFKAAALAGEIRPTGKPDVDNMAKGLLDVMSGIFFRDDAQVVKLSVEKWYSDTPRWCVELSDIS